MAFNKILVAVDINDPENAKSALEAARTLNDGRLPGKDVEIRIVYVRYYLPKEYSSLLIANFDSEENGLASSTIDLWKAEFGLDNAEFVSRRGRVRDVVVDQALSFDADVIIIGSDQPSLSSRVLGSNASAIVRTSPISVLVARRNVAD